MLVKLCIAHGRRREKLIFTKTCQKLAIAFKVQIYTTVKVMLCLFQLSSNIVAHSIQKGSTYRNIQTPLYTMEYILEYMKQTTYTTFNSNRTGWGVFEKVGIF